MHSAAEADTRDSSSLKSTDGARWLLRPAVLLRIALLVTLLVYLRTITFDWVFDDHQQITMNPWLSSWGSLKQIFTLHSWAFTDYEVPAKYYRPLYLVWLLINNQLFHGMPGWFHLSGLFLHLGVVYLAYLTARRLTGDAQVAGIAAVLFALHPGKAESIAWVAGLTEVLLAAFFFGTVLAYLKWLQEAPQESKWLLISALCFAGALFSKETAVLAPVLIVAHHWVSGHRRWSEYAKLLTPYVVVGAGYWAVRLAVMHGVAQMDGRLSASKTLFTMPLAFWWYLQHTVWPFGLSLFYPEMIVRTASLTRFILPTLGLLALGIAYAWFARNSKTAELMGVWFLLTILPPVGAILLLQPHDRYLYLPSFAFAVVVAMLLNRLGAKQCALAIVGVTIFYAAGSYVAASYWEDDLHVFERALVKAPDNLAARRLLGGLLVDNGQKDRAFAILLDGYRKHPESPELSFAIAQLYQSQNEFADARSFYAHTLSLDVDQRVKALCYFGLGAMAQLEKNLPEAESQYEKAIELSPQSAGFHQSLGTVLRAQGRMADADAEFEKERLIRVKRTRNF